MHRDSLCTLARQSPPHQLNKGVRPKKCQPLAIANGCENKDELRTRIFISCDDSEQLRGIEGTANFMGRGFEKSAIRYRTYNVRASSKSVIS